ncbi:MAG: type II toxin-antitoxin system RelE/ParE family toxin [Bryobacteraceae bacterium]|nr:type II toxin-antitoxin system RelE/ParE family toxin [Bryobacteraceae bacterium]
MKIRNFANKALKRLYQQGSPKGLPADAVDRIRKMLAFMDDMEDVEELKALPTWDAHPLKGDRKGTWSLTVTRNWRLTFRMDAEAKEIVDVDFEDYH